MDNSPISTTVDLDPSSINSPLSSNLNPIINRSPIIRHRGNGSMANQASINAKLDVIINTLSQMEKTVQSNSNRLDVIEAQQNQSPKSNRSHNSTASIRLNSAVNEHEAAAVPQIGLLNNPSGITDIKGQSFQFASSKPKSPAFIDTYKSPLGDLPLFKPDQKSSESEYFTSWKSRLTTKVNGHNRFTGFLTEEPEACWNRFCRNNEKYSPEELENHYLAACRELFSAMVTCFDAGTLDKMINEMQDDGNNNLPLRLGFTPINQEPDFYQNPFELLKKLTNRYEQINGWHTASILKKISSWRYTYPSNPHDSLREFHELYRKLQEINSNFIVDEQLKAYQVLAGLPNEFDRVRESFLNLKEVKLKDVEEQFIYHFDMLKGKNSNQQNPIKLNSYPKTNASVNTAVSSDKKKNGKHRYKSKNQNRNKGSSKPNSSHYTEAKLSSHMNLFAYLTRVESESNSEASEDESTREEHANLASEGSNLPPTTDLVLDSGATISLSHRKDLMRDLKSAIPLNINGIGGQRRSNHVGILPIRDDISLTNVRYTPGLPFSICAMAPLCDKGMKFIITKNCARMYYDKEFYPEEDTKQPILIFHRRGNLYSRELFHQKLKSGLDQGIIFDDKNQQLKHAVGQPSKNTKTKPTAPISTKKTSKTDEPKPSAPPVQKSFNINDPNLLIEEKKLDSNSQSNVSSKLPISQIPVRTTRGQLKKTAISSSQPSIMAMAHHTDVSSCCSDNDEYTTSEFAYVNYVATGTSTISVGEKSDPSRLRLDSSSKELALKLRL
jgi:gag-polypeptide of LTR copia-type